MNRTRNDGLTKKDYLGEKVKRETREESVAYGTKLQDMSCVFYLELSRKVERQEKWRAAGTEPLSFKFKNQETSI